MNRLNNSDRLNKKYSFVDCFILLPLIFFLSISSYSQNNVERYNIGKIEVSGNTSFSPITIVTFSGLKEGDAINIPGEKLSTAIKKLWGSNLFSSVDVYKTNIENGVIDLEIELYDLPELTDLQMAYLNDEFRINKFCDSVLLQKLNKSGTASKTINQF